MGNKRNADISPKEKKYDSFESSNTHKATIKTPSLKTLINWNVSKALKYDPNIDLKVALRQAQARLESARDVEALVCPDARNLSCALLAWQQLGHRDADSLFSFIRQTLGDESVRDEKLSDCSYCDGEYSNSPTIRSRNMFEQHDKPTSCQWGGPGKMDFSTSIGLVVKLPAEPQTLMRLSGPIRAQNKPKTCSRSNPYADITTTRIDSACCLDKGCMDQLLKMEEETTHLRKRATQVARREAERAELLERAEMAWRDLDCGYQRRLQLAKEKEEDFEKQTARLLDERNRYKQLCIPLVEELKKKTTIAENEQLQLKELEKAVCSQACARLRMTEHDAQIDAQITEQQCKASQLERNLALKEEQERRKHRALVGAAEAARVLTHEAEHAQRAELADLHTQVQQASQDLLEEDARTMLLKQRVEEYIKEKDEMIEDLEKCQTMCDSRMAGLVQELKKKKEKIVELKDNVMECLCKDPVDRAVEVKRTPSLAAMCTCSPSGMLQGTCSCTSMRSRLLSALLKDLFGGLKSEMESIGSQMPCHLLKCLEDKHNWDRATDVKNNVRAYFSRLLLGELDIAIATVIEKCHAQWVGECCADLRKPIAQDSQHSLRWQEYELEMKAQKMASKLAEKMFKEKAKELAAQAKEVLTKDGHPPCECDLDNYSATKEPPSSAVYRCQIHPHQGTNSSKLKTDNITQRKEKSIIPVAPMSSLKKDANITMNTLRSMDKHRKKGVKCFKSDSVAKPATTRRLSTVAARKLNIGDLRKISINKTKTPQQFSVNMCLCDNKNEFIKNKTFENCQIETDLSLNQNVASHLSNLRQSKPIVLVLPEKSGTEDSNTDTLPICTETHTCFHKTPSNTSVDRLISILTKLKDNLLESQDSSNIREALNTDSLFKITHTSIVNIVQQLGGKTESILSMINGQNFKILDQDVKPPPESQKTVDKSDVGSKTKFFNHLQLKESKYMGTVEFNVPSRECSNNISDDVEQITNNHLVNTFTGRSISEKPITMEKSAPIQPASIVNNVAVGNTCIELGNPTKPFNDTRGSFLENESDINTLRSVTLRSQKSEKYIQCLGAILSNVTSKLNLSHKISTGVQRSEYSQFLQDIVLDDKQQSKINYNSLNKAFNEIGDVGNIPVTTSLNACSNYIKFLGVTLDNPNLSAMLKQDAKKEISQKHVKRSLEFIDNKGTNNYRKTENKKFTINNNRDLRKTKCAFKRIKAINLLHLNNTCAHAHGKNRQLGTINSKEVQSTGCTMLCDVVNEPCICCQKSSSGNSNDLEVNTFQLLEEHLKGQLEEFQNSTCKSSCISNSSEKNLFGDTLLKVKKLIMESAGAVTCKCEGNNQSCGSWNRANILLQEYLKTKIEHVKCLCSCSSEIQPDENLVSRVLSKINCMIESDLQRLKGLCTCNEMTTNISTKPESHYRNEPSRFTDAANSFKTKTVSNATENSILALPYDKSAQVMFLQSVVSKSCDALTTSCKYSEVQTVDVLTANIINSSSTSQENANTLNPHSDSNSHSYEVSLNSTNYELNDIAVLPVIISSNNKIKENHFDDNIVLDYEPLDDDKNVNGVENIDKNIEIPNLPYIGCTINCSCDIDIGCVCTKSTVPKNPNIFQIHDIWNTFTQRKRVTDNYAYILNKVTSKIPEKISSVNVTNDFGVTDVIQINNLDNYSYIETVKDKELTQVSEANVCVSEPSDKEANSIQLKDSKKILSVVNDATNTLKEDYSLHFISKPLKSNQQGILKQSKLELLKRDPANMINSETTLRTHHASQRSDTCPGECDCAMVPLCHVKMLVESIGNKLDKAECTCDTLKSVCPIHS